MQARAIVADDHPLFRSALKHAVLGTLGDNILESASFDETLDLLNIHQNIELVFLDLNMPGNHGLTGLTVLRNHYPDVLVVIVSAEERSEIIKKAIDFGSSGYIPKSTPLPVITQAVVQILDGQIWVPEDMLSDVKHLDNSQYKTFATRLELLTPHQFRVLQLMADGLLNKQIAHEFQVSESTIKQHVSAVLNKLGFNNRTQAGVMFKSVMSTIEGEHMSDF
ncbi:response regulator transcription factor [Paraglaciecola psychrophila]|jgi:DNA-binding NarL/FixJ family response regulator|uniref:Two component transcriptional regulator, LuxR family n=1 Tax=Paraglaciecola psychrophila 170 TaxID=1129794 RepID=K6ZUB6_9ALTE|nr:response regulator transcription factor [Paraglaciecola psychrophila]AGH45275.1 two component transcriptional regulator, LuxR family [Paraglaciecola psychrophila 170]GAC39491.1 glycerol metabolism activator [Paraglaciecola psychrophila 170]